MPERAASELLGRPELDLPPADLRHQRVLVTGSSGFLGKRCCAGVLARGGTAIACDLPTSVLDEGGLVALVLDHQPTVVLHLAAHKHAADGEERPAEVADVNVRGTANVVAAAGDVPVVLASTCKAADPCTVYGATKLAAERIVLNAGGKVLRLVNVLDSSGSVLELWSQVPADQPLPVTPCERMWMSPLEATKALLLLCSLDVAPGRYGPDVGPPEWVGDLAARAYPGRKFNATPLRRGDRPRERLCGEDEVLFVGEDVAVPGLVQIVDAWNT